MRATVIVNPITGRGQGRQMLPTIEAQLRAQGIDYALTVTQRPGHARELAQAAVAEGVDVVVAAGGDGTVNEVVNGLIAAAQATGEWQAGKPAGTLGVFPIGSGNDFAFALGLRSHDIPGAVARIAAGQEHVVDLAHVADDRGVELFFCNNLGSGFDAAVNIEARKIKRLRGFFIYFVALLRTVALYYRTPLAHIQAGLSHLTQPVIMASIANGPRTGGGVLMAPRASITDGLLDLCVAGQVSRLGILGLVPHFIRGTHEDKPQVQMLRADHIVIEVTNGLPVHVDGEVFHTAAHRLDVCLWPCRLRVFA
mgnify:FL=1